MNIDDNIMDKIINEKPWVKELLKTHTFQDITLRNLYEFYLTNDNIKKILPLITSGSIISIRLIDWFVTNYAKKYNTTYELDENSNNDKYFNVYSQYKCELKSYKKKLFDPFCRGEKSKREIIIFRYDKNSYLKTTVGQLNFFKWALKYGIIDYVEKNYKIITKDMNISNKKHKSPQFSDTTLTENTNITTTSTQRKKRHELSTSAAKFINLQNYEVIINFD